MSEKQFYLLQVNDALFPIGGYSHSQGLETYIQRGIVHNVDTARDHSRSCFIYGQFSFKAYRVFRTMEAFFERFVNMTTH